VVFKKRQIRQELEGCHLADDSARQQDVETTCWSLCPITGNYSCHWWWRSWMHCSQCSAI